MTKAAITPLCLTLLLGTASFLPAQSPNGVDAAIHEGVIRQAARVQLHQTLWEAHGAEQRKDLAAAAKLYDAAWELVVTIGQPTGPEAQETIAGLTFVRMEQAKEAQRRGDFIEASKQVADVLRVNPQSPEALAFQRNNQKLLELQRGMIPSPETLERVPVIREEKINAATHVQNGRLLLESGKYEEAERELKVALKLDPNNESAVSYMSMVQQGISRRASYRQAMIGEKALVEIQNDWGESVKRDSLPVPNPMVSSTLAYTGKGRQVILSKLDRIHLESVLYDNLPLSEVVRMLSEESRKRDPEKRGINFLISAQQPAAITAPTTLPGAGGPGFPGGGFPAPIPAAQATDPTTGLPLPASAPTEVVDVNTVSIKINPALSDLRMADVLDAIVKVADHPIKYSLEDYAVVFSLKGAEATPLFIRRFKVDPNTFYQGLESVGGLVLNVTTTQGGGGGGGQGGGGGGGQGGQGGGQNTGTSIPRVSVAGGTTTGGGQGGGQGGQAGGGGGGGGLRFVTSTNGVEGVSTAVINFFRTLGVDLNPQLGKSVFFNDREGSLLVRATADDLDMIEAAIQTLNTAPPMITIKSKFVEIAQNDSKALGFDWYLGNFLMGNKALGLQGGTAPSFPGSPSAANPAGTFPGVISTDPNVPSTTINPAASDQLITGGLRQLSSFGPNLPATPALASLTGILTDPQFRVVLKALEQRDGADLLSEGQVTTLSGRQAQMQVVDLRTIVTGTSLQQNNGGGGATAGTGTTINQPQQGVQPTTTPISLGPTLDVIPYVSADGFTIQMTILPSIIEFIGYDDPGAFVVQAQNGNGLPLTAQLPLPHFRIRQVTTSAIVWDGQTVVLGGLLSENIVRVKDKVPVLGDLPFVGRLFRSEAKSSAKKSLVIFVTPTIIDPAGNRTHLDEDLPFAQSSLPSQAPVSQNP